MKITDVEVLVLKSPGLYANSRGSEEPPGPTYMGVVRVSTDVGITGFESVFYWYTDGTQQTVATPCPPSGLDVLGCPFKGGSSGGGGAFAKR